MAEDMADKIILLRASKHPMPMPADTAEQKELFWSTHHKTGRDAQRLLDWSNACGQYLNDLADMRANRVKRIRTDKFRMFEIYPEES